MNFVTGLIIGLIAGWLVEWVIDWLFWRRRNRQLRENLAAAEADISALNANLSAVCDTPSRVIVVEEDCLDIINGIGPVFAGRLNEAGVHTFADLAALTPERVQEIIHAEEWQAIAPESWIAQASRLASRSLGGAP